MNNKLELLAPAGDWQSFLAAIENGADAVYLGGKLFNARQSASNFDLDELAKALEYAHVRDAKIYLTMNTLISDSEMTEAVNYAQKVHMLGIDGIIVQDIGFAGLIRKHIPSLELHASTQMTVYNSDGVKMLQRLGFKRVVLARELSFEEITDIRNNTEMEIEVFIHGALCISYSGQCLMSSIIGGRSGNRGRCAQPCRLKYELVTDDTSSLSKPFIQGANYLLSPKDLCSLEMLPELLKTGVSSLKIEGRMKSPEYVATVVSIYRKHLDSIYKGNKIIDKELTADMKILMQIFNRGGFSSGYFKGKSGKEMMCYEKPKNWGVYLGNVQSYDMFSKTISLNIKENLSIGDGVEVWNGDDKSPGNVVSNIIINKENVATANEGSFVSIGNISGRINKGDRVYKTSDKKLVNTAGESFSGKFLKKIKLDIEIILEKGKPVIIKLFDDRGNKIIAKGEINCAEAMHTPLDEGRILSQLNKTGATPFEIRNARVKCDEGLAIPISEINNVRRKAMEEMEQARKSYHNDGDFATVADSDTNVGFTNKEDLDNKEDSDHKAYSEGKEITLEWQAASADFKVKVPSKLKFSLFFQEHNESLDYSQLDVDRIYLPFKSLFKTSTLKKNASGTEPDSERYDSITSIIQKVRSRNSNCEVFLHIPSITRGNYDRLIKNKMKELLEIGITGVTAGNAGTIELFHFHPELKLIGDYSNNVFNSFTVSELTSLGLNGLTLSPELTLSQISQIVKATPSVEKEIIGYGRIALMTSEYCPIGSLYDKNSNCSACKTPCREANFSIKDRMGMFFPVVTDNIDCRSTILNANVIFIPESLERIREAGVDMVRLNITDEKQEDIVKIVALYKTAATNPSCIDGQYDELISKIKGKGFTKGHLFRGV